jgi:hypothetical protein
MQDLTLGAFVVSLALTGVNKADLTTFAVLDRLSKSDHLKKRP